VAGAEALKAKIEQTRLELEKRRRPPRPPHGPDLPPDATPHERYVVNRADTLMPFLLLRSFAGDIGARPFDTAIFPSASPDIIVTRHLPAGSPPEPDVRGREAARDPAFTRRIVQIIKRPATYDVWLHVWNLGRAPAFGVRLRVWGLTISGQPHQGFLAGRSLDLGARDSETSHLLVKMGPWTTPSGPVAGLLATAECITDVLTGAYPHDFTDRHNAQRLWNAGKPVTG
jgi:hypothetical protein